jgi:SAM-dependent methyltransferase
MAREQQLCCIECYGVLSSELKCRECGAQYERASTGAPVLMTAEDRERFSLLLNQDSGVQMQAAYLLRQTPRWIRNLYPPLPVYVNPLAPPFLVGGPGLNLWIGGAGLVLPGFVNVDVAPVPGVDVIANGARLPFASSACDSIECPALLEHVIDAERVVSEMHRVLKPGGEVHAIVPFCHPYHAYPADYSRFSNEKLASLFGLFQHVEIGVHTGPTTTMLTFLTYYLKLIFPVHRRGPLRILNRIIVGTAGWLMFPFKYLDAFLDRLPDAHLLANHLYVRAKK